MTDTPNIPQQSSDCQQLLVSLGLIDANGSPLITDYHLGLSIISAAKAEIGPEVYPYVRAQWGALYRKWKAAAKAAEKAQKAAARAAEKAQKAADVAAAQSIKKAAESTPQSLQEWGLAHFPENPITSVTIYGRSSIELHFKNDSILEIEKAESIFNLTDFRRFLSLCGISVAALPDPGTKGQSKLWREVIEQYVMPHAERVHQSSDTLKGELGDFLKESKVQYEECDSVGQLVADILTMENLAVRGLGTVGDGISASDDTPTFLFTFLGQIVLSPTVLIHCWKIREHGVLPHCKLGQKLGALGWQSQRIHGVVNGDDKHRQIWVAPPEFGAGVNDDA